MTLLWTKRDKNKAKIMWLGLGTSVTQPFQLIISWCDPQRALTLSLSPPTCPVLPCQKHQGPPASPSLVGLLFQVLSAGQALRAVGLVLSVRDLPNAWRTDAKIILLWDTPWAGGKKPVKLRKRRKPTGEQRDCQPLSFISDSTKEVHVVALMGTQTSSGPGPALTHPETHSHPL